MLDIIAKIPVKYPFKKHTRKPTHMGTRKDHKYLTVGGIQLKKKNKNNF